MILAGLALLVCLYGLTTFDAGRWRRPVSAAYCIALVAVGCMVWFTVEVLLVVINLMGGTK